MNRINENVAANEFVKKMTGGYYRFDRSQNTEVNYCEMKEQRDTEAIKAFVKSDLFKSIKELK